MTALLSRIAKNSALAMASLALAFALAELVVRLALRETTVLFPRYHTDYHYGRYTIRGIRPNSTFDHTSVDGSWRFITNSKGFRNTTEFPYAKPPGVVRVLCIGDSHTQGYEVGQDATFSATLQRYFGNEAVKAEVINAGVSGFSTAEALVFLENEGFKYEPDVVVLGFFANDFEDNLKAGLFGLDAQGQLVETKVEHIPGVRIQNVIYRVPGVKWLSENSYFYSLLFNNVWNYFKGRLGRQASARQEVPADGDGANPPDAFEYAVATVSAFSTDQVSLAAALIERMALFCRARGIRLVVVDIPAWAGGYRSASSIPPELSQRLASAAIEYIDSTSVFDSYEGVVEMHRANGHHHISDFTHAVLGVTIGQRLRDISPK